MRKFWAFLSLALLVACSTSEREALKAYRSAFAAGDFTEAKALLAKAKLAERPESRLLYLMEEGRLAYALEDFSSAARLFTEAIELSEAQYTKSVTREGSKWLLNDTSGEFFGAPFERSWLFYHQALAFWRLSQTPGLSSEESRRNLYSARAALVAWDSFFQEWQRASEGKSLYQHDLAAKLVAADVHQATGIRTDLAIAQQLNKDAWKIFRRLSPAYASFNQKAASYALEAQEALLGKKDFGSSKELELTPVALQTRRLILGRIARGAKSSAPNWSNLARELGGVEAEELKKLADEKASTLTVLVEGGVIAPREVKEIDLGIKGLASLSKDPKTQAQIAQVGSEVLGLFATNVLGLTPKRPSQVSGYVASRSLMTVAAHEAAIAFEIPVLAPAGGIPELLLVVRNESGAEVHRSALVLASALEDQARLALEEESGQRIVRTGVRVVMKHVTAILAAMAIHKNLSKGEKDNMFAKLAAVGSYVAATKGIAYSERADTRAWQTLPQALLLGEASLPAGKYTLELSRASDSDRPGRSLGQVQLGPERAVFAALLPQL